MEYNKPPLTFEQQAELLVRRGLICDKTILIERLESVNYYRLSGYLYPFRKDNENYKTGTTLDKVWENYTFDRQLRLHILDGIERFEIALKTDITYNFSHKYGPFGYLDNKTLPFIKTADFDQFKIKIKEETDRSREKFVKHFFDKYGGNHSYLPLWMAAEIFSFGTLHTLFRGLATTDKKEIARRYNISNTVLLSWIGAVGAIRNICAHHGRLFNRILGFKPMIPDIKNNPQWHTPFTINNNRIFSILSILNYLLKTIAPQSKWKGRLISLLERYKAIPPIIMGFKTGWEKHNIWK